MQTIFTQLHRQHQPHLSNQSSKSLSYSKLCLTILFGILQTSCPDTTIPQIYAGGQRICGIDEIEAFREVSNQIDREDLWIAFVDVGQGDATWIRTPGTRDLDAKDILVDTGNCRLVDGNCGFSSNINDTYDSDGIGALLTFMRESGWIAGSPIDFLVATHPDKDHYGGTWKVLQDYQVGAFVSSGIYSDNKTYQTALSAVNQEPNIINLTPVAQTGINPDEPGQMSTDSWGRNIKVTLLSADQGASSDNNSSVVLMIDYLGTRILLTGDAEEPLDRRLLEIEAAQPGILSANILKAGHHAGVGTNSNELLQKVFNPTISRKYAIISSGLRDGLPNDDTVLRLENAVGEQHIYRTDRGDLLAGKDRSNSAGDDHILMRVTQDGDLTLCYAYSDQL